MERIARLEAAIAAGDPSLTVFGHLRLGIGGQERDLLLGPVPKIGGDVSTLDWQTAPLAEAFFVVKEGEDYALEEGGRVLEGRLLEKNVVVLDGARRLQKVRCPLGTAVRDGDGWRFEPEPWPLLSPRAPAEQHPFRSPLDVELDDAQKAIVGLPASRHALILGEAGFGKTTVALHRMLKLREEKGQSFLGAMVVPTDGLKRLAELVLLRRRVHDVEVWTYDAWCEAVARAAFIDLPPRLSQNTQSRVLRLKRHGAVKPVLEQFVAAHPTPSVHEDHPTRSKALARWLDLEQLFGDLKWTSQIVAGANGALPPNTAPETCAHTRVQFMDPTEAAHSHVDSERLTTVDGRRIDEGTPMEDAQSVDVEDFAVLFALERLRTGPRKQPLQLGRFDVLLLDEAQEFAPLELELMGRAIKPTGVVVVAGDAAQQVDATAHFEGWDGTMRAMGVPSFEKATLAVNYRCPPEVTRLARGVLEGGRPFEGGEKISHFQAEHSLHLLAWLTDSLRALEVQDPSASIAVICRSPASARSFHRLLGRGLTPRLALDGAFDFRPGTVVTSVEDVKGLEFDHVVLPDAAANVYVDTAESRRALYVAVTRASHRLVLSAAGPFSPLLGL